MNAGDIESIEEVLYLNFFLLLENGKNWACHQESIRKELLLYLYYGYGPHLYNQTGLNMIILL